MIPASAYAAQGKRPPRVPGLNFTAVDFETANGFRGSPCAIGLVRVRDGNVDELYFHRMRPPEGFDRFDPRNVDIHRISPERVAEEPRFGDRFEEIRSFIGTDILVAHNAAFDIEVFESSLEVSGMDSPGLEALCSVRLAREVYDLDSHALPAAAQEAGFNLKHHHHALWDARAAAAIVVDIAERVGIRKVRDLFAEYSIEPEQLQAWTGQRELFSRATRQVQEFAHLFDASVDGVDPEAMPDLMRWQDEGRNLPPDPNASPEHPLFGEQVVFTGNLSIPRPDAKELASQHGADTSSRVTGSTSLAVIGDGFDPSDLKTPDAAPPLKTRKAQEILRRRAAGQQIEVISETGYREMLGDQWPLPVSPGAAAKT